MSRRLSTSAGAVRHFRKAEIGWTWIHPDRQRTYVNTETKLLMLTHAFEIWKCIRVELKTDALNERSRNAILRIGARFEGVFRQHMLTDTGRLRDTEDRLLTWLYKASLCYFPLIWVILKRGTSQNRISCWILLLFSV